MRKQLAMGVLGLALMLSGQAAGAEPEAPKLMTSSGMQASYQTHLAAAEKGDAEAQYSVGMDYSLGFGVKQDPALAVQWLTKAAEQNHLEAMRALGLGYLDGSGGERNPALGVSWLEKAAAKGDGRAQFLLSAIYADGEDVPKDMDRSATFLRQAADGGNPDACFELGRRYWKADGLERSPVDAMRWFEKAADQKNEKAMLALASIALDAARRDAGYDQEQLDVAMRWLERAAELGNMLAQLQLAAFYDQGMGRPKDPIQAAMWATLANRGPAMSRMEADVRAQFGTQLAAYRTRLTPAQQQDVDGRVTAWIAAHPYVLRVNSVGVPGGKVQTRLVGGKEPERKAPQPSATPKSP